MNRKIKFRGKSKLQIAELDEFEITHEYGWVTGNLITNNGRPFIVGDIADTSEEYIDIEYWASVIPDSIGQYSGLSDVNDKETYEGDIVKWVDSDGNDRVDVVVWRRGGLVLCNACYTVGTYLHKDMAVIGNIYDNPELITDKTTDYAK